MKALVLAGGTGSRLGSLTSQTNKCLLDCGGGPVIDLVVSSVAGIRAVTEIVMVVGYRSADVIAHFRAHPPAKPVRFVHQPAQRGLVHAIECARPAVDEDDVLLLLGDEVLVGARLQEFIDDFRANGFHAAVGSVPTSDLARVSKTYTFSYEGRRVRKLVEKPAAALSPRMGTGAVLFSAGALAYTEVTPPHPLRGEKDLVGVLQMMVNDGKQVGWFDVCEEFANINTSSDLLEARALGTPDLRLADVG